MKVTELRIGNFVKYQNAIIEVNYIIESSVGFGNGIKFLYEPSYQFEPIELTEEWLLKFAFEKKTHTFVKYPLSIKCQSKYFYYVKTRLEIKYIHQLQNLYFALTNEELTIKE